MATSDVTEPGGFERCRNCGAELALGKEQCPACGTFVSDSMIGETKTSRFLSFRSFTHVVILGLLITIVYYLYPDLKSYLSQFLPVLSPLIAEAVNRASDDPNISDIIGLPITSGWRIKGAIEVSSRGWGEAELWIPIAGSRSKGSLYARVGKDAGPWIFSTLRLFKDASSSVDILPPNKTAMLPLPKFKGRVYIVPLGSLPELGLDELPAYYRERFGLSVELLPPLDLDDSVRDVGENKVVDDKLEDLLKRRIPRIANDPDAILIGVTTEDMYVREEGTSSMYNRYTIRGRFGFVSTYLLTRRRYESGDQTLLRTRVRKLITRDIGVNAYHLPMSDDPTSLVSRTIGWVGNIDRLSESFAGVGPRGVVDEYRVAKNEPTNEPELLPVYSKENLKNADGRYPCLMLKRRRNTGAPLESFDVSQNRCLVKSLIESDVDEIEVDLRSGLVMVRKTDVFLPGVLPVAATRCYRSWDPYSRTFGRNNALSWDMFTNGDIHPYTYMNLYLCDRNEIHYERISRGSGFGDALFEHRRTATTFLGSRIRWKGSAWELSLSDGSAIYFPGTYNARRGVDGAPIEYRAANGEKLKIERDRYRNLKRLILPSQNTIEFEYDSWNRVIRSFDNQKQDVNYSYDVVGRLIEVISAGVTTHFEYDYEDISAIYENGQPLIKFKYSSGLLDQISLFDDRKYRFHYDKDPMDKSKILRTHLTTPDGTVTKFDIKRE